VIGLVFLPYVDVVVKVCACFDVDVDVDLVLVMSVITKDSYLKTLK
jgi:hypothetical protein